jgi:hypothetical protein
LIRHRGIIVTAKAETQMKQKQDDKPKLEPSQGDKVKVLGPEGTVLEGEYKVLLVVDKNVLRIEDSLGVPMRIHKSRVAAITHTANQASQVKQEEDSMAENTAVAEVAVVEVVQEPKAKVEADTKVKATVIEPTIEKVKVEKTPKVPKVKKVKKAFDTFDLAAWVKESGGVKGTHLIKKDSFDAKKIGLATHIVVNPDTGRYHCVNVYTYPTGHTNLPTGGDSLGKSNKGSVQYPLKGHKHTIDIKKADGTKGKKPHVGTETAEEVVARNEAKGYKKV